MKNYNAVKYLTVLLQSTDENDNQYAGTGFFLHYEIDGVTVPVIVTVRHVVENSTQTIMTFHYKPEGSEHIAAADILCHPQWFSLEDCELCCCLLNPISQEFERITGSPVYYAKLLESSILTEDKLQELEILTEIALIGYPGGLTSSPMRYPFLRTGRLASAPSDNRSNGGGYVDITAVGGSSGSPILLNGGTAKLIGIMNQVVPSAEFGVYIDAYHLLRLKEQIKMMRKD